MEEIREETQKLLQDLVTIGNWAKSCTTKEQLESTKKFLNKRLLDTSCTREEYGKVMYNIGLVDGIILSIEKIKIDKNGELSN